jgi:prepilin-type N-terminal cleavage/methylation domain-containing protein
MMIAKANKKNFGFTLIEVLLSVALLAVLAGFSLPVYRALQVRNDLDIATNTVVQSLYRAQVLSQAVSSDASWGVYVGVGEIVIFQGDSYVTRDDIWDEVFDLPTDITPSGLAAVVFDRFTGDTQTTGSVILNSNTNETKTITINNKGMVDY